MSFYYQIFTGGIGGRTIDARTLRSMLPSTEGTKAFIVGWSEDSELYKALREYTADRGIALWLWFPVFSEHSKQAEFRRQSSVTGDYFDANNFDGDEEFDFCCPTYVRLASNLLGIYDSKYAHIGFDGIFLDRIRFQTMTAGIESLFGCRCRECAAWYDEHGLSEKTVRVCYRDLKMRVKDSSCTDPLGIRSYLGGHYELDDATLEKVLTLKTRLITETVCALAASFRERGLSIGIDLLAPFLAPLVGQDYPQLCAAADFIKPMLYRYTYTPAGFLYEIDAMCAALSSGQAAVDKQRREHLARLYTLEPGLERFFSQEAQTVRSFEAQLGRGGIFAPGIEVHTVQAASPVSPGDIEANIDILQRIGFEARTACWNILQAGKLQMRAFNDEE